jgi:chemotaxis methyl-accepting protein methylase
MKVQQFTSNQFKSSQIKSQPAFGAWRREVVKQVSSLSSDVFVSHRNDTSFFRGNLWDNLVAYVLAKGIKNVYFYGCSNGSEPYTFVMNLYSKVDSKMAQKIFRIVAKDFDEEAISMAKSGILPMQGYEFEKIQKYTNGNFDKFFERFGLKKFEGKETLQVPLKKEFAEKIDFSVADVTEDYKNIEPKNSLVSLRNFLPYLRTKDIICDLIKNLGKQMDSGSAVTFDKFDKNGLAWKHINLENLLKSSGFKESEVPNLFEKV